MRADSVNLSVAGMSGAGGIMQAGMGGQEEDAAAKSIRKQIEQKQRELQELSGREEMSPEEKMKRRQELMKEISDLNMQLRQHQMELRMQERAEKQKESRDAFGGQEMNAGKGSGAAKSAGMSTVGMQAIISADASVKQAKVQGSVAGRMENRAGVLKAEIKQDAALGGSTQSKEAELAEVEKKASEATGEQLNTLRDAQETMSRAAKEERAQKDSGSRQSGKDDKAESTAKGDKTDSAVKGDKADMAKDDRADGVQKSGSTDGTDGADGTKTVQSGGASDTDRNATSGQDSGASVPEAQDAVRQTGYHPVDVYI